MAPAPDQSAALAFAFVLRLSFPVRSLLSIAKNLHLLFFLSFSTGNLLLRAPTPYSLFPDPCSLPLSLDHLDSLALTPALFHTRSVKSSPQAYGKTRRRRQVDILHHHGARRRGPGHGLLRLRRRF